MIKIKTFIARQPIFDYESQVVGYELLFRSGSDNVAMIEDNYSATLKVIEDVLVNFGVEKISAKKRIFIKFTEELLLQKVPELFQPKDLVIELSETVEKESEVFELLKAYKEEGYLIALGNFTKNHWSDEMIKLADIIKIDFLNNDEKRIGSIVNIIRHYNKVLFAEKVEVLEKVEVAREMDFKFFQGYYFRKPIIFESDEMRSIPAVYYELLEVINAEEVDLPKLAQTIKKDVNLSLYFLKLVNSTAYYSTHRVKSLDTAVVRLGIKESKKIILINLLKHLKVGDTPDELIRISLRRAKQSELLSKSFKMHQFKDELFILGLFSLINIIMHQDMQIILKSIPLDNRINEVLLGRKNELSPVLESIVLHEQHRFEQLVKRLEKVDLTIDQFNNIYLESTYWGDQVWQVKG